MKNFQVATIALALGAALGFGAQYWLPANMHASSTTSSEAGSSADEPLYWVAPMDPNYRRDKPGKSPMGMDLIPIYAEDQAGGSDQPGTVTIDPSVENNLGVKTAAVEWAPLAPKVETVGYVAFDESKLWQTNVRVAGWVEKLNINAVGEKVTKGEVLFTLYSPELVKAQEELLNASRTGRNGLIKGATERLMTLGVDRQQIRSIVRSGKASQSIAIKAPADGVVASLNIREGGYLSPAQVAIAAGPLDQVWVDTEVFERQAHWVRAGSEAVMSLDALPGKEWRGEVDYVYPILDANSRTLRVRLKFPNSQGELKPNMFANIQLEPTSQQAVLRIPKSAVIRAGNMTRVVLAEGDGKYRSARISVGRQDEQFIEVLEGLKQNDQIVTSAHFLLDSESSQSADLSRINGVEAESATVWAQGEITDVMAGHNMLTINHQPVPEWDWPGMTMNFTLQPDADISALKVGQSIKFELQKTPDGQYQIIDFEAGEAPATTAVWVRGEISMLMADFGMITLTHSPVDEWQWQAGEMNFSVDETVDLSLLAEGEQVEFLVEKQGSEFQLKQIKPVEGEQ